MQITPDQIKAWRKSVGWSQGKLADHIGCTQPTVCRIENGEMKPRGAIKKMLERLLEPTANAA